MAWSPAAQHPIYLAAGTAAQQLDATFSTSAALEIYQMNLSDPSMEMALCGSIQSECRFYKLAWGGHGMGSTDTDTPSGVLVGGGENGHLVVWNPVKMMNNEDGVFCKMDKHSGAVAALDFNPFQKNLLASGASESEIYIWDLNNPSNPMTPGAKSQPPDDVNCVSWNSQVQHILGSTFSARCVVWDLRKNDPIIKISDSMSRIKCKTIAWHPEVATQLCLSSEDDHTPVIQLWDLRYATSPLKVLENHQRGILSIAWCPQDPDLLLSCGKDNRILCWNPNSNVQNGEVIYELPTSHQWSFDVQWCPRNPAVISSASFDGHISVYSLMGGEKPAQTVNKIADSFPSDPFSQTQQPEQTQQVSMPLTKPPKWLRRPVGASFAFGGKLVSFENTKSQHPQQPISRQVHISQVTTETDLLNRSAVLENALNNGQFAEFCAMKIANSNDDMEETIWNFMKVNFENDSRTRFLQLIGYNQTDLSKKVAELTGGEPLASARGVDADELAQRMNQLGTGTPLSESADGSAAFEQIAAHEHDSRPQSPFSISKEDDVDGLISQAVLTGNFEAAVEMCLHDNRMAEAILLSISGGPELLRRTQKKYFQKNSNSSIARLISSVVTNDWTHIVETCELDNWKEALAVVLTYAKQEEFSTLCDTLGNRLEREKHGQLAMYAILCYICSGNVDHLVDCWARQTQNSHSPLALQDLVEKVMVLRRAVETAQGQQAVIHSGILAENLARYAELLAAQGSLGTALTYLGNSNEATLMVLRDRLYQSHGQLVPGVQPPTTPFQRIDILPDGAARPQQQQKTQMGHQATANSGFQTVTTPSSAYYNKTPQYTGQYTGLNGPLPTQPTYSEAQPTFSTLAQPQPETHPNVPTSRGPLSHKYPSYPSTSYGAGDSYTQNTYMQPSQVAPLPGYGQTAGYNAYDPNAYGAQPVSTPGSIYNPVQSNQPTPGAPPPSSTTPMGASYQEVKPASAWNDPPIVRERKESGPKPYEPPAPITTPIYNPLTDGQQQPMDQAPPGAPANYGGMYNPQQYQAPPAQEQQLPKVSKPEPPAPVPKGPIPAEHQVLHDIFDTLVQRCLGAATNAQTKRKLEDVARKLETLYDRLRQNSLSQDVTLGLHQIIQAIQQYDYNTGLGVHTQMISQGNFSEISSFMPGVKVLLQTAAHLNVYVQ